MQRILFIILICLFSFANISFDKNGDCKNFKYGKFTSAYAQKQNAKVILDRTVNGIQTETITLRGTTHTNSYKIVWHNDCSYTLFPVKLANNPNPFAILGDSLRVTIQYVISYDKAVILTQTKDKAMIDTIIRLK
jgi:hypothetical protein